MYLRIFKTIFCILISTALSAGGGWVKSKGSGYYKINQSWVESMGYFSGEGGYSPRLNSQLFTTSIYSEHGLGEFWSMEAYIPVYVRHSIDGVISEDNEELVVQDAAGGFGDVNIGVRRKLFSGDILNLSATMTFGLPIGQATLGERNNLFTGDGEFNQNLRMDASVSFGNSDIAGYSTVYVGFNNRAKNFNNEFTYGIESGISSMNSRLWLIGRINAIDAGKTETGPDPANAFTQSMSFTNYMVEVAFYMDPQIGLSVSYTGNLIGEVLLVAPVYGIGLFMDVK